MSREWAFRVWGDGLSGTYYAGWAVQDARGIWQMNGKRYDVTADIERIIAEAVAVIPQDQKP